MIILKEKKLRSEKGLSEVVLKIRNTGMSKAWSTLGLLGVREISQG